MRILFVSPSINPFVGTGWGAAQRTNLLLEACAQLGHVDVISFVDGVSSDYANCGVLYSSSVAKSLQKEGRLLKFLRMLTPFNPYSMFPKSQQCAEIVKSFVEKINYDIIICRYIPEAMMCGLFDYADRLVIDVDDNPCDVEFAAAHTSRTWRNRMYHRYRAATIKTVVERIQQACRFTYYSNPEQSKNSNSAYLPNIPFYNYTISLVDYSKTPMRLLFVGNLSYAPNCQGADRFIQYVFPIIQKKIPNVVLHLVGGCDQQSYLEKWSKVDGVQYMGFVDDLKQEYEEARLVVVPIYDGAGTNIKVIEAMQMHRPCVTTPYGVRGFSDFFVDDKEILIADNYTTFAEKVVALLNDEKRNHTIATSAYSTMNTHFSRKVFNDIVSQSLRKRCPV